MIVKIRTVKDYVDAQNHLIIGEISYKRGTPEALSNNTLYLRCRTFHFGKNINNEKAIKMGELDYRSVPLNRIEIINWLDNQFNFEKAELQWNKDQTGLYLVDDHDRKCRIYSVICNRSRN